MPSHFIHYLTRRIIPYNPDLRAELRALTPARKREWFDLVQSEDGGFAMPTAHITGSNGWPTKEVCRGDVIWLFACVVYRGRRLPIGLDARIVVGGVEQEKRDGRRKFIFRAGPGSSWVLLADWSSVLERAKILLSDGRYCGLPLPNQTFGQSLQSLRKLSDQTAEIFETYLSSVNRPGNFDFVSYRHKDGTDAAVALVLSILKKGRSVWWDRWSLPRRLAEGREALAEEALENEIFARLAEASTVYGVVTERYDEEGAFTRLERDAAGNRFRTEADVVT